jgi:hypothetical protein
MAQVKAMPQPVNWLVIYDSDEVQRLAGIVAEFKYPRLPLRNEPKTIWR